MDGLTLSDDFTAAYDGVSCIKEVYPLHVLMAYITTFSGLMAILARLSRKYHTMHKWFGRGFLLAMLWTAASSTLITNTGLPRPIISFLALMFVFLTIGFVAITVEQWKFHNTLKRKIDEYFQIQHNAKHNRPVSEVEEEIIEEMDEGVTWQERFFSLKALHGGCMIIAWYQMFGRTAVTNPFKEYKCWTYPVAKNGTGEIHYLPAHDPNYGIKNNTDFAVMVSLPWLILVPAVGILWSYIAARNTRKRRESERATLVNN